MHRTICKKVEESLDTCPFQESQYLNNVRCDASLLNLHSCGCCRGVAWDSRAADKAILRDLRMGRCQGPQDPVLSLNVEGAGIPEAHTGH